MIYMYAIAIVNVYLLFMYIVIKCIVNRNQYDIKVINNSMSTRIYSSIIVYTRVYSSIIVSISAYRRIQIY